MQRRLPPILSALFAITACVHAYAIAVPDGDPTSSVGRHALFIAINALFAVGFARRARWLVVPAIALAAQQTYSHGNAFLTAWRHGHTDWTSAGVLLLLPVVVATAIMLARTDVKRT